MTPERIQAFITGNRWTFAKTMPQWPHEYVVRGETSTPEAEFVAFAEHIRVAGYPKRFGRATYVYFDVDGWAYWTMGNPIPETTIINRARSPGA